VAVSELGFSFTKCAWLLQAGTDAHGNAIMQHQHYTSFKEACDHSPVLKQIMQSLWLQGRLQHAAPDPEAAATALAQACA
jgi:hypothetical protein